MPIYRETKRTYLIKLALRITKIVDISHSGYSIIGKREVKILTHIVDWERLDGLIRNPLLGFSICKINAYFVYLFHI